MSVTIEHPTDRPNFSRVNVGSLTLWFSYSTVIGFREGYGPVIATENVWSNTTGKHLNYFSEKSDRVERNGFLAALRIIEQKYGV